jgi:putative ABC transport system substrate-binding protein
VIGFLSGWSSGDSVEYLDYFRRGLAEGGYVEGRNVAIEYRYAEGHFDRLPELVAGLVQRQVNVIAIPNTTASAFAAKAATQSIPIVFSLGSDPVEVGLVASLNHPGGNLTGLTALQTAVTAKRVEIVHELLPKATRIAFLVNPANRALAQADTKEARETARSLGLELLVLNASSPNEIDAAFETLVRERVGALLTNSESYFMIQRDQLAALAARHALPTMYAYRENAVAGGLMRVMDQTFSTPHEDWASILAAFSKAKSLPTYRSSSPRKLTCSSTSGPQRLSGLPSRPHCSAVPTR